MTFSWVTGRRDGVYLPEHLIGLSEEELAHYHDKQDQLHNGSSIRDWSTRDYVSHLSTDKVSAFGRNVYVPSGRDMDHTFSVCSDYFGPTESSWQIYGYGIGYLTDVMYFSVGYECEDVTLNLAP